MDLRPNEYPIKHKYIESSDGSMYLVKMVVRASHVKDDKALKALSDEYQNTHRIFKKKDDDGQGFYYLCELIEEATIIEEK